MKKIDENKDNLNPAPGISKLELQRFKTAKDNEVMKLKKWFSKKKNRKIKFI
jgi:hypothetical protein